MHGVPRLLLLGVKGLGHEADHSSLYSAQVKNEWSCAFVAFAGTALPFTFCAGMIVCPYCVLVS